MNADKFTNEQILDILSKPKAELTALEKVIRIHYFWESNVSTLASEAAAEYAALVKWAETADAELARVRGVLNDIAEMTDADNPDSYRSDDREGCLDTVRAKALAAAQPSADEAARQRAADGTRNFASG